MATLRLPTFLIGPSQGARSSTILERSGDGEDVPEIERRLLGDLPLAIAGWMRRREEDEIWGCLPLSRVQMGGRLLFRAQYLRDLSGEPYGLASGLYLGREALAALDGHAERLAALLPVPERGTPFTAAPLAIDTAALPAPPQGVPIGLEWDDRAVRLEDDGHPLEVVGRLLAGLGHPPQSRRVRGWVTTAHFPRLGAIDPRACFQLVVSKGALPDDPYPVGSWSGGSYHGNTASPPPSWPAWQALHKHLEHDPALADASNWAGNLATVAPADVPMALIERMLQRPGDGPALLMRLLVAWGAIGAIRDPAPLLRELIEARGDDARGPLLSALFLAPPEVRERLGAAALLSAEPILASLLDPAAFLVALREYEYLCLPNLSRRHLLALPTEQRFAALDDAMTRIEADRNTSGRFGVVVQSLVEALISEGEGLARTDPRTIALVGRIDRAERELRLDLAPPRLRYRYGEWLRELPGTLPAEVLRNVYRVSPDFPANLDQMAGLAEMIAAVTDAGTALHGGMPR